MPTNNTNQAEVAENVTEFEEIQHQLQTLEGEGGGSMDGGVMAQEEIQALTRRTHAVDAQRRQNDEMEAQLRKLKAATAKVRERV